MRRLFLLIFVLVLVVNVSAQVQLPVETGMADGDKVLAWVSRGAAPGRQGASAPGEIVYFNSDGSMTSLLSLPPGVTRVTPCSDDATSPDGQHFAFIVTVTAGGIEQGTLYMVSGTNTDVRAVATDLNPMSCVSGSPFEFAPDSGSYGFIDYTYTANNAISPTGRLKIFSTADDSRMAEFENVTDFDLIAGGASFISFFKNDDNEATEVAIYVWDGSNDREVATLRSDENCYYISGSILSLPDGRLAAVMGYRCSGQATQWHLYLIDPANRVSQLEALESSPGTYFPFTDSNAIFADPDGQNLFFTVPDGISNQTVSVRTANIDALATPRIVINRDAMMASVSDLPYDANNATAITSGDGHYLAVVQRTPDFDATLSVIDFASPDLPPINIDAGNQGDTISEMVFSNNNDMLYYVAGGDQGANNSLFVLNLATGSEARITRGRFAQGVLSPDASLMAIMNWNVYDDEEDPYLTLAILDTTTTAEAVVFEGGEVDAEGELINQGFAFPLAWRAP